MQFHQEMRANRHCEGLRQMGHLDPGRDATDTCHIRLHNAARALLQILAKLAQVVHRFTHRHRNGRMGQQLAVPTHIFSRQGLFQPSQVKPFKRLGPAHHLRAVESLVGIGHDLKTSAHRGPNLAEAFDIFTHMWPADLDFGPLEALRLRSEGLVDQFACAQMQPTALGGVYRQSGLRTTQQLPQRQAQAARAPIPQGGINTGQSQAGDCAHCCGVGMEEKVFPDGFNLQRIATQQPGCKVIAKQRHHRRAARADGVRVARALTTI